MNVGGPQNMLMALFRQGANPSGDDYLQTALTLYHQDIVKLLIHKGADVNKVSKI